MLDTEPSQLPATELRLREFTESDDAEVTSWFADAGELRFFAGRRLRWPLDAGQWRSIRQDPSVTAWTAVMGDDPTPVGHAEMITESQTVVRLARLAVSPALRGQGLGRALMARVIAKCRDAGFQLVTTATHPDNVNAIRGYRTLGFVPAAAMAASASPASAEGTSVGSGDRVLLELRLEAEPASRSGSGAAPQPDSQPGSRHDRGS